MAINKNFVIKNGVEVNTSLIVGDATLNKVGVGTTVPGYTLHVGGSRGGIGATDLTVTGITTVGTSGSTSAALSVVGVSTFQGDIILLGSAGVSTISFDASLDKLNFADNARATFGTGNDLQIYHEGTYSYISNQNGELRIDAKEGERGIVVVPDSNVELYYDNTKTFNTTPQGINVVGVTTSNRLNISGVSTFTSVGSNLIPDGDGSRNIGAAGSEWQDLHIDGTANIDTLAADTAAIGDLTENRVVIAGASGELEDDSNFTFDGAMLKVGTAATIAVNGNAAFAGIVTVGGDLNVTGDLLIQEDVVLDTNLTILGIATISNLDNTGAGIGSLSVSGVSTFSGDLIVGVSTLFADVSTGRIGIGTAVPASTLDVDGALTVNSAKVEDLTDNRVVIAGTDGELEDSGNLTFDGSTLAVTGAQTVSSSITVSTGATISANGNAGFAGIVTAKGVIDANGGINASSAKVEDLTDDRVVIAGSGGELEDSGNLTFDGSTLALTGSQTVSSSITVGSGASVHASTGNAAFAGIVTVGNRILVGSGLTLGDSVGNIAAAGIITAGGEIKTFRFGTPVALGAAQNDSAFRIGTADATVTRIDYAGNIFSGLSTISANGNAAFAGIVTVGGNLNVQGDIVYDEITGRNLNITGISTQAGQVNFGTSGAGATIFANGNVTISGIASIGGDVKIPVDNKKLIIGAGDDLEIFHDGTDTTIDNNTGDLYIQTTGSGDDIIIRAADDVIIQTQGSEGAVIARGDGTVELYFDNAKKLETTATGIIATGIATAGAGRFTSNLTPASGQGLELFCPDTSSGTIQSFDRTNSNFDKLILKGDPVEIYDGSTKRIETTAAGVINTGITTFSSTSHITIPVGTTAQRDSSAANGDIRYNTTLNSYEGYGNGAWGGLGGGTEIDVSVSSTSATNLTTFAHASYRSASFRVQITQGTSYQVGKYLLIHDGTTVTVVEESAIATGSMLGDITSVINGSNVEIKVTMYSASSATVTTIIDKITV
tara:strand:- start:323 stop:3334 length:3012 start_codon:yes stop_codon:yes gene_type:complete